MTITCLQFIFPLKEKKKLLLAVSTPGFYQYISGLLVLEDMGTSTAIGNSILLVWMSSKGR